MPYIVFVSPRDPIISKKLCESTVTSAPMYIPYVEAMNVRHNNHRVGNGIGRCTSCWFHTNACRAKICSGGAALSIKISSPSSKL
jgi:hypothetical protein